MRRHRRSLACLAAAALQCAVHGTHPLQQHLQRCFAMDVTGVLRRLPPQDPSLLKQALGMMAEGTHPSPHDMNGSSGRRGQMGGGDGMEEQQLPTPGHSEDDAFGELDPLMAIENVTRHQRTQDVKKTRPEVSEAEPCAPAARTPVTGEDVAFVAGAAASAALPSPSTQKQRHRRRRRNVDAILGDVLHDALKLRDMGHKPTADFVYKRSQERLYEEEYGHKPPSAKEHAMRYIPFPPDLRLHRLLPLEKTDVDEVSGEEETLENTRRYAKNYMHVYRFLPEDPWPERAITSANPVWTKRMVEEDRQKTNGEGLREWERRMFKPREGYDTVGEFCDAMDELAYWEGRLLGFLRDVPLSQRRSLPYLHEFYRMFVHRTIRAEKRYVETRNAALVLTFRPAASSVSAKGEEGTGARTVQEIIEGERRAPSAALGKTDSAAAVAVAASSKTPGGKCFFNRTEEAVERIRGIYAEAHRSLSSPTYDPLRMKKSALAPFMRMSAQEFKEWQQVQKQRRNALVAELS